MLQSELLESERLRIVPFSEEHLTDKYIAWLNDSETMRFSDQRFKSHTRATCIEFMKSFEGSPNGFWAILSKDRDLGHIGTLTTYVDTRHLVVDIGILVGEKRAWAHGYGTEAICALCHYMFDKINVRKVTMGTISTNLPMLRIMQKMGMSEDGTRIRQCIHGNREVDIVHRALFREDYLRDAER